MAEKKINVPGLLVERLIARGGMAEVYLAEQKSLGRKVAVKVMDPRNGDAEFSTRFFQEAKLLASLSHNNIITIYDFGTLEDGRLYLTMEYLPGGDLERRIKKGALPESDVIRNLRELARALNFVHSQGILHRDIKPANILFRQDGSLVLTDFGIARAEKKDVSVTQTGMTVGSPAYSSPEQAQGLELAATTDIYSVGVVLLEMFTGTNPYRSDSSIDTAIKHIQMPVPSLQGKYARYQPMLDRMLAKKPKERFKSMMEVLDFLDHLTGSTGKQRYADSPSFKQAVAAADQGKNLLETCEEDSVAFSTVLMTSFHQDMQKHLDSLLETTRSNAQQWQLMSVSRELRKQRDSLNASFQNQLGAGFAAFAQGEYVKDHTLRSKAVDLNKLSLVAHEELERNIAAANLVKRANEALQEELLPLHERLCYLIKKELPLEACPIGPYQLAQHVKKALEPLQLEKQLSDLCFKILEKAIIAQIKELYRSLNQKLIAADILPRLTYGELIRRQLSSASVDDGAQDEFTNKLESELENEQPSIPPSRHTGAQNALRPQGRQTGQHQALPQSPPQQRNTGAHAPVTPAWQRKETITPNPQLPSNAYQQQLFGAIRQMQHRAATASPGEALFAAVNDSGNQQVLPPEALAKGDWAPAGGVANLAAAPQGPVYTRADIVTALHGLQGSVALADDPDKTGVLKAFKEIKPGQIQPAPVQSLETVLEVIAQTSPDEGDEPKQLDSEDCNTIDLVGMIFEYMLKDDQLPDSVKAMLSYLHVPYIKVALLDPELFAKPEHPARLLLDKLTEAGSLWLNKEGFGQFKVFDEIKRIVDCILTDFNSGGNLFVRLLTEFDEFVGKVKRRVEQLEKLSAQKAEAEQHLQKVKAYVHKRIKSRVNTECLPAPIVAMLLYPWFDYLTSVMLRYGEKSEQWSQGLQVVDTLLWSIKPKTTQHEIHRLNNVKDFLVKQIQTGFDTIGFDQIKGQELLKQIVDLQTAAGKQDAIVVVTAEDKAEIQRMHHDTTVREKVVELPKPSEMTEHEKELVEKLRLIEFGTWFEFREKDNPTQSQKLKVAWYNAENLIYLMVNSAGKQVSMLTALELARQMLGQSAHIIAGSAKPFFERALESIYEKMSSAVAMEPKALAS